MCLSHVLADTRTQQEKGYHNNTPDLFMKWLHFTGTEELLSKVQHRGMTHESLVIGTNHLMVSPHVTDHLTKMEIAKASLLIAVTLS